MKEGVSNCYFSSSPFFVYFKSIYRRTPPLPTGLYCALLLWVPLRVQKRGKRLRVRGKIVTKIFFLSNANTIFRTQNYRLERTFSPCRQIFRGLEKKINKINFVLGISRAEYSIQIKKNVSYSVNVIGVIFFCYTRYAKTVHAQRRALTQ